MVKVQFSTTPQVARPPKFFQELAGADAPIESRLWVEKDSARLMEPKWFSKHVKFLSLSEITIPHLQNIHKVLVKKIVEEGDSTTSIVRGHFVYSVKLRVPLSNWLSWIEYELSRREIK